ncbi:large ribosomal subunit protein mL53 [Larimichthys crocea]|uniref:large ribosomal subunit protein mL53 n=1 Tax=Larimichthys crocea TaxID=215358 RepID=UPI000F5EDBD3|nr:39S ribosomal protein L53, mitochondrial [Larimichthys crocea]
MGRRGVNGSLRRHTSPSQPGGHNIRKNMAASRKATVVLKAVKRIAVQFCPFESNVRSTREFLAMVGSEKVRATNMNCEVVAVVKHDKSEPVVDVTYLDGEKLVLKGANLTSSEMLSTFQSRCTAKDPQAAAQK